MSQTASQGIQSGEVDANAGVSSRRPIDLEPIYAPISTQLESVEKILRAELVSKTPFVDQLLEHSWLLGGKRIRPVFLLLSGACCGDIGEPHLKMAAALEMIHTATLVHDDILDDAKTRRHRATANSKWGNKVSVLLGDYLFTHAFHVASFSGSAEALRMLAQASNRVCEGEMRQNAWQADFSLTEADYLQMVSEKTAELCEVGCRLGAFLSNANPQLVEGFASYGRNLGVAFQIIDDVLDVVGQTDEVGKTLGTDLINQKPTLPVIHCLKHLEETDKNELLSLLMDSGATLEKVIPYLLTTKSLDYARTIAQQHAFAASEFAKSLPASEYATALLHLSEFVLQRTH